MICRKRESVLRQEKITMKATCMGAFLFASLIAVSAHAQSNPNWCQGNGNGTVRHCEEREAILPKPNELDVNPGSNGSIRVRGWAGSDVRLRSRIAAYARTESRARELVASVRIITDGGRVRAEGPSTSGREHWGVSFDLDVPRDIRLTLNAHNGGIHVADFDGTADLRTVNGGLHISNTAGSVRGATTNGGVHVELSGAQWNGSGLDVETRNGGVRMSVPSNYSAVLETGTVNGGIDIDFPVTIQGSVTRRLTTTLGSGGPRIRAVTTNGGVRITRR
jgi:hypothetical protein